MRRYITIVMLVLLPGCLSAQADFVLARLIGEYTEKAQKELTTQRDIQMTQTTGHIWTADEVGKTTDVQRIYNDYLDSFRDIISYAAQIYGSYVEIDRMISRMGELNWALQDHCEGAFATALSQHRGQIYQDILVNSLDIVNDIRMVCLSKVKMTEKERMDIVFGIRPKLQLMNRQLHYLTLCIRYTKMSDVWQNIEDLQNPKPNKKEICRRCMRTWRRNRVN